MFVNKYFIVSKIYLIALMKLFDGDIVIKYSLIQLNFFPSVYPTIVFVCCDYVYDHAKYQHYHRV